MSSLSDTQTILAYHSFAAQPLVLTPLPQAWQLLGNLLRTKGGSLSTANGASVFVNALAAKYSRTKGKITSRIKHLDEIGYHAQSHAISSPSVALGQRLATCHLGVASDRRTSSTTQTTLEMVRAGQPIQCIARARSLASSTIEDHLVDLYHHGQYPDAPQLFGLTDAIRTEIMAAKNRCVVQAQLQHSNQSKIFVVRTATH